jgi:hypothetical protein
MTNHLKRIEAVEKELRRLGSTSAVKEDVTKLRAEMKQVYVSSRISLRDESIQSCAETDSVFFSFDRMASTSKSWTSEHTYGASNKTSPEAQATVSLLPYPSYTNF